MGCGPLFTHCVGPPGDHGCAPRYGSSSPFSILEDITDPRLVDELAQDTGTTGARHWARRLIQMHYRARTGRPHLYSGDRTRYGGSERGHAQELSWRSDL